MDLSALVQFAAVSLLLFTIVVNAVPVRGTTDIFPNVNPFPLSPRSELSKPDIGLEVRGIGGSAPNDPHQAQKPSPAHIGATEESKLLNKFWGEFYLVMLLKINLSQHELGVGEIDTLMKMAPLISTWKEVETASLSGDASSIRATRDKMQGVVFGLFGFALKQCNWLKEARDLYPGSKEKIAKMIADIHAVKNFPLDDHGGDTRSSSPV
ncbi:hypothetical protein H0H93_007072 [Arthromyces matolae]|nr:hypothetical protein H0H93_007072 [Arthromyces matolae]